MLILFALAFLLGDLLLQWLPASPTLPFLGLLVMIWVLAQPIMPRLFLILFLGLLLGFFYSAWYANAVLSFTLPKALEEKPVVIEGIIASLPEPTLWGQSFKIVVTRLTAPNVHYSAYGLFTFYPIFRLSLGIDNKSHKYLLKDNQMHVGDKWRMTVSLKRIHGLMSPGAFDEEADAFQAHIRASGKVLVKPVQYQAIFLTHTHDYLMNQYREKIRALLMPILPQTDTAPWLLALLIGERSHISEEAWSVLRNTGTNHLMAIAGLHIGLVFSFLFMFASFLWRRLPGFSLWVPAKYVGSIIGCMGGIAYAALSGFSLPAQRAAIMLVLFTFCVISQRIWRRFHILALGLVIILLCNPLVVLTESFWLSFGTIALLIYGMDGRRQQNTLWWHLGRAQWVLGIGLIPLSLYFFQSISLNSFISNVIAIPWVGFVILPLSFLSLPFLAWAPTIASSILWLADKNLQFLWLLLTYFSHLPHTILADAISSSYLLISTTIAIFFLLLPFGFPGRWFGVIGILPLIFFHPPKPLPGEIWFTILDVGQGLATVIQTRHHLLLYDTGPSVGRFDSGEAIVMPFLRYIHAKKIDTLVISHGDNDHIGGANIVLTEMPVNAIKTSVPEKFLATRFPHTQITECLAGEAWQWDGVRFSFLYPAPVDLKLGNNSSCVLRISNQKQSLLLTGDIEKLAESRLLARGLLSANYLMAPHHGSKTSGMLSFIQAVNPNIVFYSTGYHNRYHFPHKSVVLTYEKLGVTQLNTADLGTIFLKMNATGPWHLKNYRTNHRRYWLQ